MKLRIPWRGAGYLLGLVLFFAPFAYYQKTLGAWLGEAAADIHSFCLRIPLLQLLTGQELQFVSVGFISLFLLLVSSFFFGPFFCGRLCASGALPEYLSRLVPERLKINWQDAVEPTPVRYGFLVGYLVSPFFGGVIACALCNYNFLERLVVGSVWGEMGPLASTTLITAFLWLGLFGVMAKGGRGFCSYLCPVGAVQSLVHAVGARFSFAYKLRFAAEKCRSCGNCVQACPVGALKMQKQGPSYQIHLCLTCRQCEQACPCHALSYGCGYRGWEQEKKRTFLEEDVV